MQTLLNRSLICFAALLVSWQASAQTSMTRAQLEANINTNITTNGHGELTGAILNSVLQNMAASTTTLLDPPTLSNIVSETFGTNTNILQQGPSTPTAGTSAAVDWIWGTSANQTALTNEASIWNGKVYIGQGLVSSYTSANNSTDAGTSPNTSLFSLAINAGTNNDVVGALNDCLVSVSGGTCFGHNDIARNAASTSAKLVGNEIDVEFASGSTDAGGSIGLPINVYNISSSAIGVLLGGVGGGTWANGFGCGSVRGSCFYAASGESGASFLNASQGTYSQTAIVLGQGASQGIFLGGTTFGTDPLVYGDSSGSLIVNEGTTDAVVIKNHSGSSIASIGSGGSFNAGNYMSVPLTTWADNQTCSAGQFVVDAGFLYVCTATNTVKRAALSTF